MSVRTTKKQEVFEDLRRRMTVPDQGEDQPEFPPGTEILSQAEIQAEYDIGRETAVRVIGLLRDAGLIEGGGHGTRFRVRADKLYQWHMSSWENQDKRRDDPAAGRDDWAADMHEQGGNPDQEVEVTGLVAPPWVADLLELERDDKGEPVDPFLIRRRRVRYVDGKPWGVADSWFTTDIANRTCEVDGVEIRPIMSEGDVTIPGGFVRAIGIVQDKHRDLIHARKASPEELDLLDLTAGDPVLVIRRRSTDEDGRRVRVIETVASAYLCELVYDLDA